MGRKLRKRLERIHWIHAAFLFALLCSGGLLYFSGSAWISKKDVKVVHLILAAGYILFLLASIPSLRIYIKRLKNGNGKKAHILLMYGVATLWLLSGLLLWLNFPSFLEWRLPALFVHDWFSVLLLPWVLLHVYWKYGNRHASEPSILGKAGRMASRREFLQWVGILAAGAFAGACLKWFQPFLSEEDTSFAGVRKRKGYFRIFKVTDEIPSFDRETWKLTVDGMVDSPRKWTMDDLESMDWVTAVRDFHCVTGWSVTGVEWKGIPFYKFAESVKPRTGAIYVNMYSSDQAYNETYKLEQLMSHDVILAFQMDSNPLIPAQGAPCRLVHPQMYGYKSIKWVERIEITDVRGQGYWEALEHYDLDGYIEKL